MSEKIAITGRPGCGKTTLCKRVAEKLGNRAGGLITEEIREAGKRVGFRLEDLTTGDRSLLSHVEKCSGPKIGKYSVCLDQLESVAPGTIKRSKEERDLLIVDEIGPMELKSDKFVQAVEGALETETNCLFTVHQRSNHPLLQRVKAEFKLIKLTKNNRARTLKKVLEAFRK